MQVGKTAMEFAEEQEHTECIETLQQYIAKVGWLYKQGESEVWTCCGYGPLTFTQELMG